MSASFAARYPGTCHTCELPIEPGQQVRYDDYDQVEHVDCDANRTPVREAVRCPTCWLTSCDCDPFA